MSALTPSAPSADTTAPAPEKRKPGRPKKTETEVPRETKAGAYIYDETEELVFVEGAVAADEVICDGTVNPGLSIDTDGTRVWNCATVGGTSALRARLRQGNAAKGEAFAAQRPSLQALFTSLRDRERCVSWDGAATILQYVFKPQVIDTKLSSPKSARGCIVALRQSVATSGFLRDVLHGPLIIDFAESNVPVEIIENALDIAAWIRAGLRLEWGKDPKALATVETANPAALVRDEPMAMQPPPAPHASLIPLDTPPIEDATTAAYRLCPSASRDPLTSAFITAGVEGERKRFAELEDELFNTLTAKPEQIAPRTVGSYLDLPISIKASVEHAELGTGETLGNILAAVCGETDWPKWGLSTVTNEARMLKASGDEAAYKAYKRTRLPVFYPSATWTRPRRDRANTDNVSGTTGIVCLDFDHFASTAEAEDAKYEFACANRDHLILAALSCSGRGFFALVCADTGGTGESFKAEAARLMDWARSQGYEPDASCVDVTRGRILAVDTDAIRMADDWPITPPVHAAAPVEAPRSSRNPGSPVSNDPTKRPSKKRIVAFVARAAERVTAAPVGNRNSALTSACGTAARLCELYGYDRQDAEDRLRFAAQTSGLDPDEITSILKRYGPLSGK